MKRITQDIKENKFQRVYLLCGDETYLRNQFRDKLIDALTPDGNTMNLSHYHGKDLPIGEVIDLAETLPFLAEKRVIVIEDSGIFGAKGSAEKLAEYIKDIPESTCLIFSEGDTTKKSKMYKAVDASGYVARFDRQGAEDIKRWVLGILKKENLSISGQALEEFLQGTGDDMLMIRQELDKLIAYAYEKEGISTSDVLAVCVPRYEDKIFDMLDHIMGGRTDKALVLYHDLQELHTEPQHIMYMLERQLRIILHAKDMKYEGKRFDEMAKILGIKEFAAKKAMQQAGNCSRSFLEKSLQMCADTDVAVRNGRMNEQIGTEVAIISMANSKKL